ncbi:MAG: copper-translocating P-type ATPase [bacterium]|nr:copper-translocating P-type ATPase [bacterium]
MADPTTETVTFDVEGMTCASCAMRIERVLGKQDGVEAAVVNLTGKEAKVTVHPGIDITGLTAAVEKMGYGATQVMEEEARESLADRYDAETRYQRRMAIGAAILTIPAFLLMMFGPGGHEDGNDDAIVLESELDAGVIVEEMDMTGMDTDAMDMDGGTTWPDVVIWLLVTPVVFVFGWQFHRTAFLRLRSGGANMDTLISMGTLAAYTYSVWAFFAGEPVFFETAAWIITFILLGRFFEARSKRRASSAITRLLELGAKEARVLRDGAEVTVPIDQVAPGDHMVIRPGEKVPTDGKLLEGRSSFDEAMLSGESKPVDKSPGDEVFGATINQHGMIVIEATRVGSDTALAQIVHLVEDAQTSKAPIQRLADRISGVFVPVVLLIATATLVGWLLVTGDVPKAVQTAVAVLIIACPCALGLATPTAIMVGSGRGAELGILFKNAEIFERTRAVTTVVFDKTGTLTRGAMTLSRVVTGNEPNTLHLVGSVESANEHPIARAVALGAEEGGAELVLPTDFENLPGRGARGTVDGLEVAVGSTKLMAKLGLLVPARYENALEEMELAGETAFLAGWDGEVRAVLAVADTVRESSARAIASLQAKGLATGMLTGDNHRTAETIAGQIGIDRVMAEVLPGDKAAEISRLQSEGEQVAFVGDGVNDAPALVQADLGMAIGTGTDVAIEAGDVVLMNGDPELAVTALSLAARTFEVIRQNLFWAFAYNTAAIPLAAAGLLHPMIAASAMAMSSVSVVGNSLRLKRFGR